MESRLQIVAILVSAALLLGVLELVRQRRVMERYALLWLFSAAVLLGLAVWKGLLERVAGAIGVVYAPSALFVIGFGFILLLLLHFSTVISGLTDQNKVLAQHLGLLRERLETLEAQGREQSPLRAGDGIEPAEEDVRGTELSRHG